MNFFKLFSIFEKKKTIFKNFTKQALIFLNFKIFEKMIFKDKGKSILIV